MTAVPARTLSLPYASGALRDGDGRLLRPGGPELTELAIASGGWRAGQTVIDVGCGEGTTLEKLARLGLTAVGVDVSETRLRAAGRESRAALLALASGDALPLADGAADGVLAECSLSLMPDTARALAEFHRVLRPGGRLVVTDVYARDPDALERPGLVLPGCLSGILVKKRTLAMLGVAGFTVVAWEDHSQALKAFIGRLIFAHGSADALWRDSPAAAMLTERARGLRPGYALVVATKPAVRSQED